MFENLFDEIEAAYRRSMFSNVHFVRWVLVCYVVTLTFILSPGVMYGQEQWFLKQDLFSVSFPTDQLGWACGRWGTVLHSEDGGQSWALQDCGTDYTLMSIIFTDTKTGWAVGNGGTIVHTEDGGKTWVKQKCPVDYYLMDVCFVDDQKGWIVTEWTHILHTSDGGKNWEVQFREVDYILKSVSFCDPLNGWAAGEYGYIYHTSDGGRNWEHQAGSFGLSDKVFELVGENSLFDIVAVDPKTAWAVGIDGTVTRTVDGGKTWEKLKGNFPRRQLFDVTAGNGNIIIGGNRTLIASSDRGENFVVPVIDPPITYGWLYGVTPRGSSGFVAVGKAGWIYVSDSKGSVWKCSSPSEEGLSGEK